MRKSLNSQASNLGSESGCFIDPRAQYIVSLYSVNIDGYVKCVSTTPAIDGNGIEWSAQGYDDSAWPAAVAISTNPMNGTYRHSPAYPSTAKRYWTGDSATTVYCRVTYPRKNIVFKKFLRIFIGFCNSAIGDMRYCYNNENCTNRLCTCQLPFGGFNCSGYGK